MMIDREKVIRIIDELIFEAQKAPTWKAENALRCVKKELLKDQEAVPPIPYHRSDGTIFKYECRKCRTKIFKGDLFCRHCGNPVLWEGR